jgi:hypothetical protein
MDNCAGQLPLYQAQPAFALRVYSGDFSGNGGESTTLGLDQQPIPRGMSFMVERHSDEDVLRSWAVSVGQWVEQADVAGMIEPQWDPSTGRSELAIPITTISSGSGAPQLGSAWASLVLTMARYDQPTSSWIDGTKVLLHYRLSSDSDQWIFGNIETVN